jgi:hypothetical protein
MSGALKPKGTNTLIKEAHRVMHEYGINNGDYLYQRLADIQLRAANSAFKRGMDRAVELLEQRRLAKNPIEETLKALRKEISNG